MAAPRITQEAVFEVANQLSEKGEHPSVATVRETLGSGSFSTINKYLQLWREQRDEITMTADVPEKIEAAYRQAASVAWLEASRLAGEQVTAVKDQMEQERTQHTQQSEEAAAEIERLEKLVSELEFQNTEHQKTITASNERETTYREDSARLKAETEAGQKRVLELQGDVRQLTEQNSELHRKIGVMETRLEQKQ